MAPSNLPVVAIAGGFQNGKSTLLNCLLDDKYAPTGNGVRTTPCCTYYRFGEVETAQLIDASQRRITLNRREDIFASSFTCKSGEHLEVTCWKPLLQHAVLVDTPGFNANGEDDQVAAAAIQRSSIIILVASPKMLDDMHRQIITTVQKEGKRLMVLMNCTNHSQWHPAASHNQELAENIHSQLDELGALPFTLPMRDKVVLPFNPLFAWYALGHLQRDLDLPQEHPDYAEAEEKIDQIEFFCKKQKWSPSEYKAQLLKCSGILEIRHAIQQAVLLPLLSIAESPMAELQRLAEQWSTRLGRMMEN